MNKPQNNIMLIIAVIIMDLLTGMEFDLFVPSFSQLQQHFNITAFWVEGLLSINFIGYCLSLFIVGALSDRYGRKPIITLGLVVFILGSILCLAKDWYALILLGRFLQGAGISAPAILSFVIIADRYPIKKQQFFMAMLNGSMNIAVGIAPIIGSFITLYFQWRGNFITLLILGVITLIVTRLFVPGDKEFNKLSTKENNNYASIVGSKTLLLLILSIVVMFVPYWIFVGVSPLLYIKSLHVSYPAFGLYQGILAVSFAIGSIAFGFMLRYCTQQKWLKVGIGIFIINLIILAWVVFYQGSNPLSITFVMLVFVIGQIIPSTIVYPLAINLLPHAKAKVSAVIQGSRLIISALCLEIAGYFYNGSFHYTGIMIMVFVLMIIITQYSVIKNTNLFNTKVKESHL